MEKKQEKRSDHKGNNKTHITNSLILYIYRDYQFISERKEKDLSFPYFFPVLHKVLNAWILVR